jgi:hypothetical protein
MTTSLAKVAAKVTAKISAKFYEAFFLIYEYYQYNLRSLLPYYT